MNQGYQVITIAGNGQVGFEAGNALEAMFYHPTGICCSTDGRLYVADFHNHIIKVIYNNQVAIIAGNGKSGFQDGNALEAMFHHPWGICCSTDGRIYVYDESNHRIRMIHNDKVTTIAGNGLFGFKDGNALEAMFSNPPAMCCSADGRIYVADNINNRIRMVYNNQVTTIAGNGKQGFQDGNAHEALFRFPWGICCSLDGILYVSDRSNHRIRMIHENKVTTIAGNGKDSFQDGNALEAMFDHPAGICCSADGRLYVSDQFNNRIRMIYNDQVTTIAGSGLCGFKDGNGLEAMFNCPWGICSSTDGKLYLVDRFNNRIRMIYNHQDLKPPFGFALLLEMKNTFCDCQITFNGITYHLHRAFINLRCPLLFDQSYFDLIVKSNISNKSFESFVTFLYTNRLIREHNLRWPTAMSITIILELIFMIDLLMDCKSLLKNLKTSFTRQLIEMLTMINRQESIKILIVELLTSAYNLKELIKTRPVTSRTKAKMSQAQYCYDKLVDELQQRRSMFEQHIPDLQRHIPQQCYASIMNDTNTMSEASQIDTTDNDESIIECELAEMSKLAFEKTNIFEKLESLISTQHLEEWTRPDFVIKLSNDDIEYHVHKLILCGRWKYFCLMIESGLSEANNHEMTLTDDWTRSRFVKLMKYIYLNEIEFDPLEDVEWLMENRKLYGITVDKIQTEKDNEGLEKNGIEEVAAYGFEDLYMYCVNWRIKLLNE